jgi:dihydrofolate reductase
MTEIILIAACAENRVIGRKGGIPWHIREDFRHFQKLTLGHACLMGDVTFESLPDSARPLPGRENLVLTLDETYRPQGAKAFMSWREAMDHVGDRERVFICGGASVYRQAMPEADRLELTRIHKAFEGDTYFPRVEEADWELIREEPGEGKNLLTGEVLAFSFQTYLRR